MKRSAEVRTKGRGRSLAAIVALLLSMAGSSDEVGAQSTAQPVGTDACVLAEFGLGCAQAAALDGVQGLSLSPDGRHLYAAAGRSGSVTVLEPTEGGGVRQLSCASADGSRGSCARIPELEGARDVVVSPEGSHVYVTTGSQSQPTQPQHAGASAVLTFQRDVPSGGLTLTGCVRGIGGRGRGPEGRDPLDGCSPGPGLVAPHEPTVSADGRLLHLVAGGGPFGSGLFTFARDPTTGMLRFLGCTTHDGSDGECRDGLGLAGADGLAPAPDGRHLYVAAGQSRSVVTFSLGADDVPSQTSCLSWSGTGRRCRRSRIRQSAPEAVAVSPDGAHLYIGSSFGGIAVAARVTRRRARSSRSGAIAAEPERAPASGATRSRDRARYR